MKKSVYILLLLLIVSFTLFAELTTSVEPSELFVGETGQLVFSWDGGSSYPELKDLPKIPGIEWAPGSSHSSSTRWINGKVSRNRTVRYAFTVTKKGSYIIPSLPVYAGRERLKSKAVVFRALDAGNTQTFTDPPSRSTESRIKNGMTSGTVQSRITFLHPGKKVYVGEQLSAVLSLYMPLTAQIKPEWPDVTLAQGNAVFRIFDIAGQGKSKFDRILEGTEILDGTRFRVIRFPFSIRPIASGKLKLDSSVRINIYERVSSQRRSDDPFDDPFFDSMFSRQRVIPKILKSETETINVLSLPPKKDQSFFLGLVGNWKTSAALSAKKARAGEAVTLTIRAEGDTSPDALLAPSIDLPGFRTYSPEIEKKGNTGIIRYVLIPTSAGEKTITLDFCTFDPEKDAYPTFHFEQKLHVSAAAAGITGTPSAASSVFDASAAPEDNASSVQQKKKAPAGILYLKTGKERFYTLPLWKKAFLPCTLILGAGILFWLISELFHGWKKIRENDPGYKRRMKASREKNRLLREIRDTPPPLLTERNAAIAEAVNDHFNLPPGTDLSEAAEFLKKQKNELGDYLEELSSSSWGPAGGKNFTEGFKRALLKALSRTIGLLLLFLALPLSASPCTDQARTHYDSGKFTEAAKLYQQEISKSKDTSPELCYNLGNALFQLGKYPQSLVLYERARVLSPRDSDILENLNLTRRKLRLPQKYHLSSPGDFVITLRDYFRPDEWLFAVAFALAFALGAFGARHYSSPYIWKTLISIGIVLFLVSGTLFFWQNETSCQQKTAFVLVRNPEIRALPSGKAMKLELDLPAGSEVLAEEHRAGWIRIRSGAFEGWIPEKDLAMLFPD